MLRSLYSAVSGVKAHQTYLDVTGNNIANVNTVGFKRDVIHFRDMIYQTSKNASQPNPGVPIGGVNPAQVGLGVAVGSIETVHTQGSLQNTGIPTDMAIQGSGYFVVKSGTQQLYTRAGNFSLDRDGNLVMQGNGYMVQGYEYKDVTDPATGNLVRQKDPNMTSINIPIGEKIPAKATTLAAFRCNLCNTAESEIPDMTSIPGGAAKTPRPHDYKSFGGEQVTYVRPSDPTTFVEGETYYNTTDKKIYIVSGGAWVHFKDGVAETYYYGKNLAAPAAGQFTTIYSDGSVPVSGPAVTGRKIVDIVDSGILYDPPVPPATLGAVQPATLPTITSTMLAGTTLLDTNTGRMFQLNSTRTAWTEIEPMQNEVAYGVRDGNLVYVKDSTGAPLVVTRVLDTSTGNKNVFEFTDGMWKSINDTQPPDSALRPSKDSVTTQATIEAFGQSIIKSRDWEDKFTVYDSLGNPHTMNVVFRKVMDRPADPTATPPVGAESEWDWYAYYTDSKGNVQPQYGQGAGTLVFGDDGLLKRTYYYEPTPAIPIPNDTKKYNWSVVEKIIGDPLDESKVTGKVVADFNMSGAQGSVISGSPATYSSNLITLDFLGSDYAKTLGLSSEPIDGVTSYGSPSTTKLRAQDGYEMGVLNDWSIGADGIITGAYSNGRNLSIAQVALAMFANPQGLSKVGETCFAETINSGIAQVGAPQTNGAGSVQGNTIEMSNVDLSEEFVSLIRAQRGFQANTRVVTTSDQVLEELINMKR